MREYDRKDDNNMQIGTISAEKGKLVKGYLEIGYLNDGEPVKIPVLIASGETEGEVLWVEGGIHGTESGGTLAIIETLNSLDLKKLKGTVVGVPVVNIAAHRAGQRLSPIDGTNLNRVFPGRADGSYTEQLADAYFKIVSRHANYLLDFHSGGETMKSPYYCGDIFKQNDETSDLTKKMLDYTGADAGWIGYYEEFHGKLPSQLASLAKSKIPALMVERGGGDVTKTDIDNYKQSILGCLKGFGFLEGEPPVNPKQISVINGAFPTGPMTHKGGLFLTEVQPGAILKKGEPVVKIINLFGEVLEEMVSPADGVYVNAIMKNCTPVNSGEMYGEFAQVLEEE